MRNPSVGLTAALVILFASACSDPTSDTAPGSPSLAKGRPGVDCQLGCIDPPPDTGTTSPVGLFLGSGVTDVVCFDGSQTDSDADGISDFCEKNLAPAFAPQLAMTKGSDNLGREPHIAVRKLGTAPKARIMYMLSYYVDRGPVTSWCNSNVGGAYDPETWRAACEGHDGDSEWITLDVYYDRSTQRWIVEAATLSQHTGYKTYSRTTREYPALEYPGTKGGYPRVYVAYQKHANYPSDAACDAGSIMGTDTCQADLFERVVAGDNVNVRSRAAHTAAQDCWPSTNPIYSSNGIKECYWTFKKFLGWHVGYTGTGSEYTDKLRTMGF
ncbi:MAG: hypothetical protein ACJ8BF_10810 [Gemmatimonadales bacterium]